MKSKHVDKLIDGRWQLVRTERQTNGHYLYVLKNIYNDREVKLQDASFYRVMDGKTSVSKVMSYHIRKEEKNNFRF